MLLCAEYVLPITAKPIENGAVLVRDGRIIDIGTSQMMRMRYADEEVRDFGQAALLPGFVNVHTHLEYTAMRGIVHDVPYATWLIAVNEKTARMSQEDLYDSAVLGGLEALSSGVTCLADITPTGHTVRALKNLGLRGVVYREIQAMDKHRVDFAMNQGIKEIESWQEDYADDRLAIGIAPAALYECHPSIFGKISAYAGDRVPVALHVAGSREEYSFIRSGKSAFAVDEMGDKRGYVEVPPWLPTGVTPINYALNWGAFEAGKVLAVHAVHVDDDDIAQLRKHDVSIAHCPRCNAQLGMGFAPIDQYLKLGMRVGLGTDSPAATDASDMLMEMRTSLYLQRATSKERFIPAYTMLEVATMGGARALHMDDRIGSLDIGKQADIIAIDLSSSHQTPTNNPMAAVVNTCTGTEVLMTMVAGDILYEQNKWHVRADVATSIAHVIEMRSKLRA